MCQPGTTAFGPRRRRGQHALGDRSAHSRDGGTRAGDDVVHSVRRGSTQASRHGGATGLLSDSQPHRLRGQERRDRSTLPGRDGLAVARGCAHGSRDRGRRRSAPLPGRAGGYRWRRGGCCPRLASAAPLASPTRLAAPGSADRAAVGGSGGLAGARDPTVAPTPPYSSAPAGSHSSRPHRAARPRRADCGGRGGTGRDVY